MWLSSPSLASGSETEEREIPYRTRRKAGAGYGARVPASYRFLTTWVLDAPRDPVWEAIHAIEHWPEWWRGVECVMEEAGGDEQGIGAVYSHRWRSILPYSVRFEVTTTRVEEPSVLEGAASSRERAAGRSPATAGRRSTTSGMSTRRSRG
jgi:hypothetical protein